MHRTCVYVARWHSQDRTVSQEYTRNWRGVRGSIDLGTKPLILTLSQREGAPLNWRPSADAVAGNGGTLSCAPSAVADAGNGPPFMRRPSADAVAGGGDKAPSHL